MDNQRFDALAKSIGSRRGFMKQLLGVAGALAGLGAFGKSADAAALRSPGDLCSRNNQCVSGVCLPRDKAGRQRCSCNAASQCPTPSGCQSAACNAGVCGSTTAANGVACENGLAGMCCGGVCVDTAQDEANCGGCGTDCAGKICTSDGCCNPGISCGIHCCFTGDSCVESSSSCCFEEQVCDSGNGYFCCPDGQYCVGGACVPAFSPCTTTSNCLASETCASGECCPPAQQCGGTCCDFGVSGCAGSVCASYFPSGGVKRF